MEKAREGRLVSLGDAEFVTPLRHPADTRNRSQTCLWLLGREVGASGIFSQDELEQCTACAQRLEEGE